MYRFLVVLTIASTLGLESWLTLFNNFAVEVLALEGLQVGFIQSVREIPGFLAFLVVYLLLVVKEHRLSALAIVVLGLGMALTGLLPSFSGLIFSTLIMSFGFHYFDTTCDSLTLQYFDKEKSPWLFYFLTFMAGARRQIFMAFAVFLLVRNFDFSVREVTTLFVINSTLTYFLYPLIGRCIMRFGERRVLSLEYASLIFVFLAYATIHSKMIIALLYILDQIFYNFHIAIQTYFQKIADPGDIASSISVSFTINHIAAVVLPAIGGILWMIDYRIPFVCGAVFSLVSLMAVQKIKSISRE